MIVYAPAYYNRFRCIADRCKHSCCIGWEIDVDEESLEKYRSLSDGYGKEIADSLDMEGVPHFRLCEDERCPHLDERGLCRIITECSEEYLCDICREHPRFYNYTPKGKAAGLGMSCEEASAIILSADDYDETVEIGNTLEAEKAGDFDPLPSIEKIYSILKDRTVPYTQRLVMIYNAFGVDLSVNSEEGWRGMLSSLEYLREEDRELFLCFCVSIKTPPELEEILERALAYFVYRHVSGADGETQFREGLGFSLFCERLLASVLKSNGQLSAPEAARIISEELEYSEDNTEDIKFQFLFI